MKRFTRVALALTTAAALTMPSVAAEVDVSGLWHPDGSSDYEMSMCGKDNAQLCIKVVALRGKMDTDKNRPYLNTMLVDQAKPAGAGRWKGKLTLFGQTGDATMTLISANSMNIKVCAYVVVCKEYKFARAN